MAKTTEELKGCVYRNTCVENKHLCCHFCKDKKCEDRCLDNREVCKFKCELPPQEEEKEKIDKINIDKLKEV